MKPVPFDPKTDLAPLPFDQSHLDLAREMKARGVRWKPHVGCFVWDHQELIEAPSPFPLRVYFVLSLPRFVDIFGSVDNAAEKLVWLPTWHQARLLAASLGIGPKAIAGLLLPEASPAPGQELLGLYRLICSAL
jgi:hypothetical protein